MAETLDSWLAGIELRPTLYLPKAGLTCLASFIAGYDAACRLTNGPYFPWDSFAQFVACKLDLVAMNNEEASAGFLWTKTIEVASGGDDEAALRLFFTLWHEYLESPILGSE